MHQFPVLYKKTSAGNFQYWLIKVDGDGDYAYYESEYGQLHGVAQYAKVDIFEGKNIGKANETNCYEQAFIEARSIWNKKKDSGYTENKQGESSVVLPMLAQRFDQHGHKIEFPCYIQPKLDGIRCLATGQNLQSRRGKSFNSSLQHLLPIVRQFEDVVSGIAKSEVMIDGELYHHAIPFQKLSGIIRTGKVVPDSDKVQYHVYDVYIPNMPFSRRWEILTQAFEQVPHLKKYLKKVSTAQIKHKPEVWRAHSEATTIGYEGVMLRNASGLYVPDKRSYDLQKVKKFIDEEFEIVDGVENKGKQAGQCTFVCKTKEGYCFKVKPEGTDAERREYWDNLHQYIGKKLTVRYFEMTTSDQPVPRFPIGIAIRDYE